MLQMWRYLIPGSLIVNDDGVGHGRSAIMVPERRTTAENAADGLRTITAARTRPCAHTCAGPSADVGTNDAADGTTTTVICPASAATADATADGNRQSPTDDARTGAG